MQTMLKRIQREAANVGLKINVKKSKEMGITMNETVCETNERVTQFAYLGSTINNTGGTEANTTAHI
jgi:hypothetical protein